jgi:hypothetical protein
MNTAPLRWDDDAKALIYNHIQHGRIDPNNNTDEWLDFYNKEYFSRYCDRSRPSWKHQERKRLRNAFAEYQQAEHLPRRAGELVGFFFYM